MKLLSKDERRRPTDFDDLEALIARADDAELGRARESLRLIADRGHARGLDLPAEEAQRRGAMDLLRRVVAAQGGEQEQVRVRLEEVEALFGLREAPAGTLVSFSPEGRGKRPARSA